jgi:hypothetical protein
MQLNFEVFYYHFVLKTLALAALQPKQVYTVYPLQQIGTFTSMQLTCLGVAFCLSAK